MLFHKKNKKLINAVWTVIGVLVAISMVILYMPGMF